MPVWLIAGLVTAAFLLAAWWFESRATVIIAELKAIRQNLDKLRAARTTEENPEIASGEREPELPGHKQD